MSQKNLNLGEGPNTQTGDMLRDAALKIEDNFSEVYAHALDTNNPHAVTTAQIGAIHEDQMGVPFGLATLNPDGKLNASQKPRYEWSEIYGKPTGINDTASEDKIIITDDQVTLDVADVVITGNLTVQGATTQINSNTLNIGDNIIVLNQDWPSNMVPTQSGGIEINRGSSPAARWLWNETVDAWSPEGADIANVRELLANAVVAPFGEFTNLSANSASIGVLVSHDAIHANVINAQQINGPVQGNSETASKLTTARLITVEGDAQGLVAFDGSMDVSLVLAIADATTTDRGLVVLSNAIDSLSTTTAATPAAVKTAYDLANDALPRTGGIMTGPIQHTVQAGIEAFGLIQDDATQLHATVNVITLGAANTGVRLPLAAIGTFVYVINAGSQTYMIYPTSGAQIDAEGVDEALAIQPGQKLQLVCTDTDQWYALGGMGFDS